MATDATTTGGTEAAPYLTVREAADRLQVSRSTLDRMIAAGQLPAHRFGRAVRIKRTTLDAVAAAAADHPIPTDEAR